MVAVICTVLGLLTTQPSSAAAWSGTLSWVAARPSYTNVEGPGTLIVNAVPGLPAPYSLSIYDDAGNRSATCYANSQCVTTGYAPTNGSTTYTAYVAQDAPTTGRPVVDVKATSSPITIMNLGYINTSLTWTGAGPSYTNNDGPTQLQAQAAPGVPAPYFMSIYDDTGARAASCYASSYCNVLGQAPTGGSRTFTAYVAQDTPSDGTLPKTDVKSTSSFTIENIGWQGSLTMNYTPAATGAGTLQAQTSPGLPAPYFLSIYDSTGARVGNCYASSYCNTTGSASAGSSRTYTAYVAQDTPTSGRPVSDVRAWATTTLTGTSLTGQTSDGIDPARLSTLLTQLGPEATAETWLAYTAAGLGTHQLGSTVTDQQLAFDAEIAAGHGISTAVKAALLAGGGAAATGVAWFLWTHPQTAPTRPASTSPPAPVNTTPSPTAPVLTFEDSLTADFLQRNPTVSAVNAQIAARTCISRTAIAITAKALAAKVDINGTASPTGQDPCKAMPIYLPGSTWPQTTQHDFDAITAHPAWIRLNYVSQTDRGTDPNKLTRDWFNATCGTRPAGKSCDEYPFYASAQSGPGASLKYLDSIDNSRAGGRYGNFTTACKLTSGGPGTTSASPAGTAFLVIPMVVPTAKTAPPTTRFCRS